MGIVMANPSYEGLGYLNFIVTYGTFVSGGDYFGDRDENANTRGINDDFYSSGNAFVITQGDVNAVANDNLGQWYTVYGGTDAWTTERQLSHPSHTTILVKTSDSTSVSFTREVP